MSAELIVVIVVVVVLVAVGLVLTRLPRRARERAESQLAKEKAKLHERGLADHELIDPDERERFAGTSAAEPHEDGRVAAQAPRVGGFHAGRQPEELRITRRRRSRLPDCGLHRPCARIDAQQE
jgi:hypothetical protein